MAKRNHATVATAWGSVSPPASRRQALQLGLGAAALAGCRGKDDTGVDSGATTDNEAPTRSPEPDPFVPDGPVDTAVFPFGVQVGDATVSGALVHCRGVTGPVEMVLLEAQEDGWVEVDRQGGLTATDLPMEAGVAVRVQLTGLAEDTAYTVVFTDSTVWSAPARFRTAPSDDTGRVVTFGASSCFGGNEPWAHLFAAAEQRLDCFCLLGDTVYADGSRTVAEYRSFWDAALSVEGMKALCSSTSLVATWDDHEIDNNWSRDNVDDDWYAIAAACFREALPMGEGPGGTGVWRRLRWGSTLELFVLDCRAERDPSTGQYISAEQMAWLKTGLSESSARFKIILNSVPITDLAAIFGPVTIEDRWSGFPDDRDEILGHIASEGIPGVLWVSGDVHYAQIGRVDPAGGVAEGLWEVFTGPAGSFVNVAADLFVGDPQYEWMSTVWNWCRFTCDPVAGTIAVAFVDDTGSVFHERVFSDV